MKKLTKVITAAGLAAVLGVSAIAAGQLIPKAQPTHLSARLQRLTDSK